MPGEIRPGADFFKRCLEKERSVGDQDPLPLLLETFEESGMIGAGFLQRLEPCGGNTCRAQVADGGSSRSGETRKLGNRREVG